MNLCYHDGHITQYKLRYSHRSVSVVLALTDKDTKEVFHTVVSLHRPADYGEDPDDVNFTVWDTRQRDMLRATLTAQGGIFPDMLPDAFDSFLDMPKPQPEVGFKTKVDRNGSGNGTKVVVKFWPTTTRSKP